LRPMRRLTSKTLVQKSRSRNDMQNKIRVVWVHSKLVLSSITDQTFMSVRRHGAATLVRHWQRFERDHLPFTNTTHIECPPCHGASLKEKHTNRLVPRSIDIAIGFQPLETCNLAILPTGHDPSRERFKYIPGPISWTTLRKP